MRNDWNVMIAAGAGVMASAMAAFERLAVAWPGDRPLNRLQPRNIEAMTAADLAAADIVLLVPNPDAHDAEIIEFLNRAEEAAVPVLALLDAAPGPDNCYSFGGAMIACFNDPPQRTLGLLEGALQRQAEVKRLRGEIALSQRFHGGLKGQIAKMHDELQLAASVQREFLPRDLPAMHGIEFGALWRPTHYVSGDIYDVMRLDEDNIGVFIADAVGHGVPAALMTMVICRSLVTKEITGSTYRLVPPGEVLSRLNTEMIRRQGRTTRFITAVYALVNCRERTMTLAGAGHPPPVRLSRDGGYEALQTVGGLLGVFEDEQYEQIDAELHADDRVLFYTDGFEQAFPSGEGDTYQRRLPTARYRSEFNELGRLATPAQIIDAISRRLDDQSGSLHQVDDLTLICMHAGRLKASEGAAREAQSEGGDGVASAPRSPLRLAR